jgi:Peptidyl-tRNA hydrolase PTH2
MLKLYIVLRADLTPGLMIPQACHAQDAFYEEHPELYAEWRTKYKNLIVKEVFDEPALVALRQRLNAEGVTLASYNEEDLGHSLTAIAFYGQKAKRFAGPLPLALQPPKAA